MESVVDTLKNSNDAIELTEAQNRYIDHQRRQETSIKASSQELEAAQKAYKIASENVRNREREYQIEAPKWKQKTRELHAAKLVLNSEIDQLELSNASQRARLEDMKEELSRLQEESNQSQAVSQKGMEGESDALRVQSYKSLGLSITGPDAAFLTCHGVNVLPLNPPPSEDRAQNFELINNIWNRI